MPEEYFIQKNNTIIGPFERSVIINMLNNGKLNADDRVSQDKKLWQPPYAALNLIIPEKAAPVRITPQENPPEVPGAIFMPPEPEPEIQEEPFELDSSFKRILSDTVASLGNNGKYLRIIWQKGSNAVLLSGGMAAIIGLLLTISSCAMFCSCYNLPPVVIYVRCTLMSLLAGAVLWIANVLIRLLVSPPQQPASAEADFLAAMHGMMNISAVLMICNAAMFIFNKTLFSFTLLQLTAAVSLILLPIGFLLVNTVTALRLHLMYNANIKSGAATLLATVEVWLLIPLFIILQHTVYTK